MSMLFLAEIVMVKKEEFVRGSQDRFNAFVDIDASFALAHK